MKIQEELNRLKGEHLYRQRRIISSNKEFPLIEIDSRELVNFGSNNYLNLGNRIDKKLYQDLSENGLIQQASPLISGYTKWHQDLEIKLAKMKSREASLLFSSGFTANLATITSLCQESDLLLIDKLSHASIMETTKYKDINYRVFPHKNYDYMDKILEKNRDRYNEIFIVTDTLFSMDGDMANLKKLRFFAEKYNAYIICDDAHATGVYGSKGSGLATRSAIKGYDKLIITGTLSKAMQAYGGFVAADHDIIELLVNKAKPYIYNTALPLVHVLSALNALEHVEQATQQRQLWQNICYLKKRLDKKFSVPYSPIFPIVIGDNEKVVELSQSLLENGFFVPAIRYPTVPKKKAMLRISISAGHSKKQLEDLAKIINTGI